MSLSFFSRHSLSHNLAFSFLCLCFVLIQIFLFVFLGFMIHEVNGAESIITNVIDHYGKTVYAYSQKRIPKKHDKIKAASARHTLHQELFA